MSLLRSDKNILQYDHGSLMNMIRSLVCTLNMKTDNSKNMYIREIQCRIVLMMAKNIYVPFVIQVMVGSKTPHFSKLAIKNLRLLLVT